MGTIAYSYFLFIAPLMVEIAIIFWGKAANLCANQVYSRSIMSYVYSISQKYKME